MENDKELRSDLAADLLIARAEIETLRRENERLKAECAPVVHGHWIWYYTSKEEMSYGGVIYTPVFECSVCGHRYESYRRYDEPMKEDADYPKFCEYCGARMDEVSEDG